MVGTIHLNDEPGRRPMEINLEALAAGVHEPVHKRGGKIAVDAEVKEARLRLGAGSKDFGVKGAEDVSKPRRSALPAVASKQEADLAQVELLEPLGRLHRCLQTAPGQHRAEIDQRPRHGRAPNPAFVRQLVASELRRMDTQTRPRPAATGG